MSIRIGTAGLGPDPVIRLRELSELGLRCAEVEFTHGVRMSTDTARLLGRIAKEYGIVLSVHCPFYINLLSVKQEVIAASKKRILDSCEKADDLGAEYVVFHPGYYGIIQPKDCFISVSRAITQLQEKIRENGWKVKLAPESTGRTSQFGSLQELMLLRQKTGCELTIDFAHLCAREQLNVDYKIIFRQIGSIRRLHCHFTGIEWGPKGERKHVPLQESFFMPLAAELKSCKSDITLISESPDPLADAIKMRDWLIEQH